MTTITACNGDGRHIISLQACGPCAEAAHPSLSEDNTNGAGGKRLKPPSPGDRGATPRASSVQSESDGEYFERAVDEWKARAYVRPSMDEWERRMADDRPTPKLTFQTISAWQRQSVICEFAYLKSACERMWSSQERTRLLSSVDALFAYICGLPPARSSYPYNYTHSETTNRPVVADDWGYEA